jgi:hypothetical protein
MEPLVDHGAGSLHEPAVATGRNGCIQPDWHREVPSHNKVYR